MNITWTTMIKMSSLVHQGDRGRCVTYLGCCMMTTCSTGLGVLQKPLRDLYFSYCMSKEQVVLKQQTYLTMSSSGMLMAWTDTNTNKQTKVFYEMPNILFWDAVQFIVVKGTKKLCCAFEPLDNDHSRNKDNLFTVLEKKYNFMQQLSHPPLFACVLRRTSGLKALDVHAFVCSSDREALGLIHSLNAIQDSYTDGEVSETGAFCYKPFNAAAPAGLQQPVTSPLNDHNIHNTNVITASQPDHAVPSNIQHLAASNAAMAAAAARNPSRGLVHSKSFSSALSKQNTPPSNVFSLQQQHFISKAPKSTRTELQHSYRDNIAEKPSSQSDHVYQYINHIGDTSGNNSLQRDSYHSLDHRHLQDNHPFYNNENVQQKGYESMTRSIDLFEDTLTPTVLRPSQIAARFEEKVKNTAAVRPLITALKDNKLGQEYSLSSGEAAFVGSQRKSSNYENSAVFSSPANRSVSPSYSKELPDLNPSHHSPSSAVLALFPPSLPARQPHLPERARPLAADARLLDKPPSEEKSLPVARPFQAKSSPFGLPKTIGFTQETAQAKPIAKVTPHKVSGVGIKVLPSGDSDATRLSLNPTQSPLNSIQSRSMLEHKPPSSLATKQQLSDEKNGRKLNWQPHQNRRGEVGNKQTTPDDSDRNMSEKLLLSKKKDAEIASVMQNLRIEYDSSTITPGVPAGNNFEKSLGYFP